MSSLNIGRNLKGRTAFGELIGNKLENIQITDKEESIKEVETYLLIPFKNHPFKLYEGDKLNDMVESIKEYGILHPVIARVIQNQEELELLSGHNRVNAAKIIGLKTIPAIIKTVDDDTAAIIVAEANFLQRQELMPSEKAKAYKMQLDALKRQGKKKNFTDEIDKCSNGTEVETSRDEVAKKNDTSASQIRRYIRLNFLTDGLLEMVDINILKFRPAVEISYLSSESQKIIESLIKNQDMNINLQQALQLKEMEREKEENLTLDNILEILSDKEEKSKKISIPMSKIKEYLYEDNLTTDEIVDKIIELLKKDKGDCKKR